MVPVLEIHLEYACCDEGITAYEYRIILRKNVHLETNHVMLSEICYARKMGCYST